MEKVMVVFIKKREYQGKMREIGDIVSMYKADVGGYLEFKVVDYHTNNTTFNIDNLKYKELQAYCKRYQLPAVGKREDLIKSLKTKIKPLN